MTTPEDVRALFAQHWTGSDDELDTALAAFYADIYDSLSTAAFRAWPLSGTKGNQQCQALLDTVDDYVCNHYFS